MASGPVHKNSQVLQQYYMITYSILHFLYMDISHMANLTCTGFFVLAWLLYFSSWFVTGFGKTSCPGVAISPGEKSEQCHIMCTQSVALVKEVRREGTNTETQAQRDYKLITQWKTAWSLQQNLGVSSDWGLWISWKELVKLIWIGTSKNLLLSHCNRVVPISDFSELKITTIYHAIWISWTLQLLHYKILYSSAKSIIKPQKNWRGSTGIE